MVAGIVVVGGITRLTRSGLSMTNWKVHGALPPMTLEEWTVEFERYKTFPEWQQRKSMTLEDFKYIYFWEYGHRMMGRSIGIVFAVPGLYFFSRGMIPRSYYPKIAALFGLGGCQGLIGWWMVRSGLENVDPNQKKEIRVSPYRLATHLTMAFATFTLVLWTGLDLFRPKAQMAAIAEKMPQDILKFAKKSRKFALHNAVLLGVTVVSGAYVAGNDAGRAYNTFPKMGDEWIPQEMLDLKPEIRDFFENTALVQFDHRVLAISTLAAMTMMVVSAKNALNGAYWAAIPSNARTAYKAVAAMSATQVLLGITTLLHHVPIALGSIHQAGAIVLLTFTTYLAHSLGFSKFAKNAISNPAVAKTVNGLFIPKSFTVPKAMNTKSLTFRLPK